MIGPRRRCAALVIVAAIVVAQQVSRTLIAAALDGVRAPERLSETGIEQGRPFSPQYPLWSDGAAKSRWVYLPPGTTIDAATPAWDFPVGTRFWKELRFNGRKVETRMLWKASASRWEFAAYVWDAAGREARLAPPEGVPGAADLGSGKQHGIPSVAECRACHDGRRTEVLGFNALQLSTDRDPNAIHGEPLEPGMVTLRTLVDEQTLRPARPDLLAPPPRIAGDPATRAVVGYFTANCGHCHNRDTDLATLGPSLKHSDVADGEAVARGIAGQATAWQVPGKADGTRLIDPAAPDASAILARMRSRRPSSQMPPTGTVVADQAAIEAIRRWASQLGR